MAKTKIVKFMCSMDACSVAASPNDANSSIMPAEPSACTSATAFVSCCGYGTFSTDAVCITAVTAVTTVSITAIIVLSITLFLKFILTSITYTLFFFFKDY